MNGCLSCGKDLSPGRDQQICEDCEALANPIGENKPTRRIGSYTLSHELGQGRYATSWLAEAATGGGVILKLLRPYAPDSETSKRFLDEAHALSVSAPLDHPAIARVLDAGVHLGGALFLVYESGGETTLADELRNRGRISSERSLELIAQACEGVHALHQAGYAHFDLKPANIGVTRDDDGREQAVVLDAMTGHLLTHSGLRETGMLPISTAAYLSPEISAGHEADERADLYSLAVICYQLLSGRLPLTGHTAADLIESHRSQRPLRLRDVGRRVHGDLEEVLQRALAKDPRERFFTGKDLAAALRKVAPIADQATFDPSEEEVEDPVPIAVGEPREPDVAPPPKRKPDDPVFERPTTLPPQMATSIFKLGDTSPGVAPAKSWFSPLRIGAAVAVLAAIVVVLFFALRPAQTVRAKKKRAAPIAAVEDSGPSAAVAAAPVASTPPAAPAPAAPASHPAKAARRTVTAAQDPFEPPVVRPSKSPPAKKSAGASSSAARTQLADAQKQLKGRHPKPAMRALYSVLGRSDLSADDRARATRMMAEAETQAGNPPAAIDWYRKYLRLTEDPAERRRVAKQIQALNQ